MKLFAVSLFMLILPAVVFAEAPVKQDILVYSTPISYHRSYFKKNSEVSGIYFSYGQELKYSVEGEYDKTKINYKSGYIYNQNDVTVAYNMYNLKGETKFGAHNIKASKSANDGLTLFAARGNYDSKGNVGRIEAYYSNYKNYSPSFTVIQVTTGMDKYNRRNPNYTVSHQARFYIIHTSKHIGAEQKDFLSAEDTVSYTTGKIIFSVNGWVGKQAFAVRNGGFVVYNLDEIHYGGLGAAVSYIIDDKTKITLNTGSELLRDIGTENKVRTSQVGLMLGRSF